MNKKSVLMAMSASVLLTGCLVKKSDYEAEQSAHKAALEELSKLESELASTSTTLKAKSADLSKSNTEVAELKQEMKENATIMATLKREVQRLKQSGTQSTARIKDLEKQLKAAETAQEKTIDQLNKKLKVAYAKNKSDRAASDEEMAKLRNFMIANYSEAKFHEFEANGGVMPATSSDAQIVVKKPAEVTVNTAESTPFTVAVNNLDYKEAGKIAMDSAKAQTDAASITKVSTDLINQALVKNNAPVIKWVSVGLVSGADASLKESAREAIISATNGTVYEDMVILLLQK